MTVAALEVADLQKTYANGVKALRGVSLAVQPGDFFALLGPNGAGKSTLIGIVSSLVNPSAGAVRIFGHDLARERGTALSLMGLVPQELNFNQFEKPFDIVVNQAGFYGIPRAVARERAEKYLANPKQVHWIVEMGTERARTVARQTMKDVREAMGLNY